MVKGNYRGERCFRALAEAKCSRKRKRFKSSPVLRLKTGLMSLRRVEQEEQILGRCRLLFF